MQLRLFCCYSVLDIFEDLARIYLISPVILKVIAELLHFFENEKAHLCTISYKFPIDVLKKDQEKDQ